MQIELRNFNSNDGSLLSNWANKINAAQYISHIRPDIAQPSSNEKDAELAWYVIQKDGVDIGTVWLEKQYQEPNTVKLGILIGNDQEFGKGIGKQAIGLAIERTRNVIEFNRVIVHVRCSNIRAIKCYLACGFGIVNEYEKINAQGQSMHAFRMEKKL